MKSLSISGSSYREQSQADVKAAKLLQTELIDRAVKDGEAERDKLLAQYAAKIESVRSALRSLVGPAVIALGERARSISS